jgi:hypothetical protein
MKKQKKVKQSFFMDFVDIYSHILFTPPNPTFNKNETWESYQKRCKREFNKK